MGGRALWRAVFGLMLALGPAGCDEPGTLPGNRSAATEPPAARSSARPPPALVEISSEAGIDFIHDPVARGAYLFPEITGAGCGFLDYDNDGWLDIYLVQSGRDLAAPDDAGQPNRLYRNRGDGTFEDVTERSGAGDRGYGQGLAVADYNNDGHVDIYVQNVGRDTLLHNRGDGTFTDVTEHAGVGHTGWAIGGGFLDVDRDGWLDIFVANYVEWSPETDIDCAVHGSGQPDYCGPMGYRPSPDLLYRNRGNGTFEDVSRAMGLHTTFGPGMSAICADFDDNDWTDIYVGNDATANQLWLNRGEARLIEAAVQRGCAVSGLGIAQSSMGCNAEDFNRDGKLDLFMCHYFIETHALFLNRGHYYEDVSSTSDLPALSTRHTGFGACALDLFNDATLYLYIGNGGVRLPARPPADRDRPMAERDQVLRWSQADGRFMDVSDEMGAALTVLAVSRGVAIGDVDNDGDPDVLISANDGPARLLRNDAGDGRHWFMVRILERGGQRNAIGAKVWLTAGGRTRRRDLIVNYSYASASDPRLHFGLGDETVVEKLRVRWPDGAEAVWEHVPADQVFEAHYPP